MEQQVIEAMRQLGFTQSDARIYLGLLKGHPATGYELATRTGVPRSAIYASLAKLEVQGLVNSVQEKPARYQPLPPQRLFELLKGRFGSALDELKGAIEQLDLQAPEARTWTLHGHRAIVEQARTLIEASEQRVVASLWRREARLLAPALRKAAGAGALVVLFSFNPLPRVPGELFSYEIPEPDLERYWSHKLILISDHSRLLVGSTEESEESRAVVTEERALIDMALSNLVLDITLYGQRTGTPSHDVIARLTEHNAPVEELVAEVLRRGDASAEG